MTGVLALLRRMAVVLALRRAPVAVGLGLMLVFYAVTWVDPYRFGPRAPWDAHALLFFEFLFLATTILLWSAEGKRGMKWLALVFVVFAAAMGAALRTPLLLAFFAWHVLTGLAGTWTRKEAQTDEQVGRILGGLGAYLLTGMIAAWAPLPTLGWAEGIPADLAWIQEDSGATVTSITPAWGTLYFAARLLLLGVWEGRARGGRLDRWYQALAKATEVE